MKALLAVIVFFISFISHAQPASDLDLLLTYNYTDSSFSKTRQVNYVFKGKNAFVKYNPVSLVFGGSLLFYQKVISPQLMQGCAFDPSCSGFSKECIKEFGIVKGVALSADRLTRCTRLSSIDFHPLLFNEQGKVNDLPSYYRLHAKK